MTVVKRPGVVGLIRERRQLILDGWRRFPKLQQFLQDHAPIEWEDIRRCRLRWKALEWRQRPGHYKVAPAYSCWKLPYCIHCTRSATNRRVLAALDHFQRCTPAGQAPRFVHIVQTAPIYEDGTGWGVQASQNIKEFGAIVADTLREFYGEGMGAVMSYQDFGERAFAKRHPHIDLTLNGWMLKDGKPARTPRFALQGGGREQWDAFVADRARSLAIDAQRGSLDIGSLVTGAPAYFKVLRYQIRELIDFRKLDYSRDRQMVWWRSYKDPSREAFTVNDFLAGLAEYRWRLKQWPQGEDEGIQLHRRVGHLGNNVLSKTQKAMGGRPVPHGKDCPCSDCGDWDRVFLDEVDEAFAQARPTID